MIAGARFNDKAFKRAMTVSAAAHTLLFAVILINPSLPKKATPKGAIHYFGISGIGGGGGGGNGRPAGGSGGQAAAAVKTETAPAAARKDMLRDLAVADKIKPKAESKLRYPVDGAKTKRKPVPEKKASISKAEPGTKTASAAETAGAAGLTGEGSGMLIGLGGTGEGTGDGTGEGFGGGFDDGLADFPYAYYLNRIQDELRVNWFPSRIDPGPGVILQSVVYFRIYRDGKIDTVKITRSSGLPNFDMIAQRAVTNAAPFPPLPAEYDGEYLGINLLFEHKR